MNTVNSLFPFIGALISFALIVPIFTISGSWKHALGIWGFGCITVLVLWVLLVKDQDIELLVESDMQSEPEKGLYLNLWKRKAIKLLVVAFSCDFLCYSYIATILPTLLLEVGNMSETAAGYWSAIAFPAMGIVGASIGGIAIAGTSRRKPSMAVAQLFKFTGIMSATLGAYTSVWFIILGIALFGLGNSMWMPGMYMLIMELEDMNPSRVGAAFALISSCGFVSGFVSPIVGGWLTNQLMLVSHIAEPLKNHVFGLKWSLFIFGFSNLIAFASILKLKETDSLAYVQGQTGTKI